MRIVQEREQERHGDRLQSRLADRLDQRRQFVLGERRHHLALRIDPFGDLEPPAPRHQHRRRVLQQIVKIGARRTAQFQDVAHAARRDEAGARALVLQQRVGDHRGGMRQQRHIGRIDAVGIQTLADAVDHRLAEILRRGRQLGDGDAAGVLLHQGDVGEGAADIDADPPRHAIVSRLRSHNVWRHARASPRSVSPGPIFRPDAVLRHRLHTMTICAARRAANGTRRDRARNSGQASSGCGNP